MSWIIMPTPNWTHDRLDAIMKRDTDLVLQLSPEQWKQQKIRKESSVPVRCTKCNLVIWCKVGNVARCKKVACICSNRFKYNSAIGRQHIAGFVRRSRFELECDVQDLDLSKGCYSQIALRCHICKVVSTPQVGALTQQSSCGIGCLCSSPDERAVFDAVSKIVAAANLGSRVERQFDFFGELKGVRGKKFRSDIAVFHQGESPILVLEVDGAYHFGCGDPNGRTIDHNRTEEHDLIKEQWCIDNGIPMLRIACSFVRYKAESAWAPHLSDAYSDCIAATFQGIRRVSNNNCYVGTIYATRRLGSTLEVIDLPV